jgi:hypothetical protein
MRCRARSPAGRLALTTPPGRRRWPSTALTLEQAVAVLAEAQTHWFVCLRHSQPPNGVRTEEAHALRWSHVVAWAQEAQQWQPITQAGFDHGKLAIYVWRSVRAGGDTKT